MLQEFTDVMLQYMFEYLILKMHCLTDTQNMKHTHTQLQLHLEVEAFVVWVYYYLWGSRREG